MQNRQNPVNRNTTQVNYSPNLGERRAVRRKRRGAWRVFALVFFPIVFVLLTSFLAYASLEPIARPYISIASLLIRDSAIYMPEGETARNMLELLEERPAPEPVRVPASPSVPVDSAAGAEQVSEAEPHEPYEPEEYVLMIPLSEIEIPSPGDQYGRITISGTRVDAPVFWDDDYPILNSGVGTHSRSPGAWLPGFGMTVMMAGHRNTDFLDLFSAEIGEFITVETHYGAFVYEITDIAVFHMRDPDSFDFTKEYENIIVYTCYPRDLVGRATYRLFVYGILVSGIQVDITS